MKSLISIKKAVVGIVLAAGLPLLAQAQYSSADLVSTNLVINGSTNLTLANYAATGGFVQAPAADHVSMAFITTSANTTPTNVVATIVPVLDDVSRTLPLATNAQFSVTGVAAAGTNKTYLTWFATTNLLGAKWFKVTSITYTGNPMTVRLRAGGSN